ncbi:hypothetical protein [Kineococcus terrestris]|uniref:hypothetical protein n=1 Tax=Kineococcus terrestris TaxID=2044856 RepID=UPI0034DB025C
MVGRVPGRAGALVAAVLLAVSACGDAASPGAPVAAPTPAPDACGDLAACRLLERVDVDGDGAADDVALVSAAAPGEGVEVRVATAAGALVTRAVPVDEWVGDGLGTDAWWGSTALDGEAGEELLLLSTVGAHTSWFTVLTWRAGALEVLSAPEPDEFSGGQQWWVDASRASSAGVTVEEPGLVTWRTALVDDALEGLDTRERTYRWREGSWQPAGEAVTGRWSPDEPLPEGFQGWHAPGLPVL